jgi:hypothetical protein
MHCTGEPAAGITSNADDVLAILQRVVPRPCTIHPADLARVGLFCARTGRGGGAVVDGLLCVLSGDGDGVVCRGVVDGLPEVEVGRMGRRTRCSRARGKGRSVGLRGGFRTGVKRLEASRRVEGDSEVTGEWRTKSSGFRLRVDLQAKSRGLKGVSVRRLTACP